MKKNRPGVILNVICKENDEEKFAKLIFKYTSTIDIKKENISRYTLDRKIKEKNTEIGKIRVKKSSGYETQLKKSLEFEDIRKIADEKNISLEEIKNLLK